VNRKKATNYPSLVILAKSWPIAGLDPFRLSMRLQVMRIIFAISTKVLLDGKLGREAACERDRQRALAELARGGFRASDEA
jgi:hypothetical protein